MWTTVPSFVCPLGSHGVHLGTGSVLGGMIRVRGLCQSADCLSAFAVGTMRQSKCACLERRFAVVARLGPTVGSLLQGRIISPLPVDPSVQV